MVWSFSILRVFIFVMECLWMAPLTPTVMVVRGFAFHPFYFDVVISGSFSLCLCLMVSSRYLSWQYTNFKNCNVRDGVTSIGLWLGAPRMPSMLGLSLVGHWHCGAWQIQSNT